MTPELHAMLLSWLESGDDIQKIHARNRLSMPDAIGYEKPPGWTPPPAATLPPRATTPPDPWAERIRECPDYNPGCCSVPFPFCSRFNINPKREQCITCLGG